MFKIKQYKTELEELCDFTEIYDHFRLVNPYTRQVYTLINGKAVPSDDLPCYQLWNRDSPCANCISLRTCQDQAQYMKLEYSGDSVLMIVARPVLVEGRLFSLELVTDVTNSMVVQDEFHKEQVKIAELIANVNRLSVTDIFTGLYNNAYIKNKITEDTQRVQTSPFSILIIDIDHFKQVNDHYGHLAGDMVIQNIALTLDRFSELPGCSVGRMGGDEYCVVFENCGLAEAERFATQAALEIQTHRYAQQNETFTVSISIGIGEYIPGEAAFDFIKRVDLAMYENKHMKAALYEESEENPPRCAQEKSSA